jgi:Zn-dependent protease
VVTPWSSLLEGAARGVDLRAGVLRPQRSTGAALLVAAAFAVLVYVAILIHELAHAAAARHYGYPVHRIELHVLGSWTTYERARSSPGRELVIALAGPVATLAVAAVSLLAAVMLAPPIPGTSVVVVLLARLGEVSVLIGLYNLLPGLPLDGGALVKSAVWRLTGSEARGTIVGGWAGLAVAVFVLSLPFLFAARAGVGAPDPTSVVIAAVFAAWLGAGAVGAVRRGRLEARRPSSTSVRWPGRSVLGTPPSPRRDASRARGSARRGRPLGSSVGVVETPLPPPCPSTGPPGAGVVAGPAARGRRRAAQHAARLPAAASDVAAPGARPPRHRA